MAKYNVQDGDGSSRPYNTLTAACKYGYDSLKRVMDEWGGELDTRVIWDKDGNSTDMYIGRLNYKRHKITYLCDKNRFYRISRSGARTPITPTERQIIYIVENNPKNW